MPFDGALETVRGRDVWHVATSRELAGLRDVGPGRDHIRGMRMKAKAAGLIKPDGHKVTLARVFPGLAQLAALAATVFAARRRCSDFRVPPAISYSALSLPYFAAVPASIRSDRSASAVSAD